VARAGPLASSTVLLALALAASIAPLSEAATNIASSWLVEEYSYMMIVFAEALFLVAYLMPGLEARTRLDPGTVLTALFYAVGATAFSLLSRVSSDYSFQFAGATLAFVLAGATLTVLSPRSVREAAPILAAAAMLVPLPRSMIESLAVRLSPVVGGQAALITGSELVRVGNRVFIDYGSGSFEIVYACSGVVSLTGVLALLPLVIYATKGARPRRRLAAIAASLALGAAIVYLGNLLRIVLIVEAAKRYGSEAGLQIFHSTPSIVYVAIASAASIWVSTRIAGGLPPRRANGGGSPASTLAAGAIFLLALGAAAYAAQAPLAEARVGYVSPTYLEDNIVELMLPYEGVKYRELESLKQFLGASRVYAFQLEYESTTYRGYIEVAKSMGSFHDWTICLEYQGFTVEGKWVREAGNTTITFYRYRAPGGPERVLAVAVYTIQANSSTPYYVRVSVFPHSTEDAERFFTEILRAPLARPDAEQGGTAQSLETLVKALAAITAAALAYHTLLLAGRLAGRLIRSSRGPRW